MKNLAIFLSLVAICLGSFAAHAKKNSNSAEGNALISFERQTHDFGILQDDKNAVSTEFEFVNTGNAPLVIFDATADCGCTRPSYPQNPIAPGKKGKIKVTFVPQGYLGGFSKNIKVRSNASKRPIVLKISGTVNPNKSKK